MAKRNIGEMLFEVVLNPEDPQKYEMARLTKNKRFKVSYMSFYEQAQETFSKAPSPTNSKLLNTLKTDLKIRREPDSEGYKQLMFLSADTENSEEAFEAMSFFARTFTEKGRAYFSIPQNPRNLPA